MAGVGWVNSGGELVGAGLGRWLVGGWVGGGWAVVVAGHAT